MKLLKTFYLIPALLIAAMCLSASPILAQTKAERKAKRQISKKAEKLARKEAKRLTKKEGYRVFPGALPLEKQLERAWIKQYELNEDGDLKYLVADGNGVGKTQTAAEMQAMEAAKLQIAGQITNDIIQIIESKIANDQIDRESGNSLTKVVSGSKNYIQHKLMYIRPVFKAYRNVGKKDIEVVIKIVYSVEDAMRAAEKALEEQIREQLEEESDELIREIDSIINSR